MINPSELTAIDVHVHLEHTGEATAADAAAKQYFGAGAQADWTALADYYRSRIAFCEQVAKAGIELVSDRRKIPQEVAVDSSRPSLKLTAAQ